MGKQNKRDYWQAAAWHNWCGRSLSAVHVAVMIERDYLDQWPFEPSRLGKQLLHRESGKQELESWASKLAVPHSAK